MSGMSFEGYAPTDGQYWFVAFFFGVRSRPRTPHNQGLNFTAIDLLFCARVHPFGWSFQLYRL